MCDPNLRRMMGAAALLVLGFAAVPAKAQLTITPTFDSSITGDANAALIEGVINNAIAVYESTFSDPINVTIKFEEMSTGLGQSNWYYYHIPYSTFYGKWSADAKSADDGVALAHTPGGSTNPVTGTGGINVKTANLRAIGITGLNPPGGLDGTIGLNTHITDIGSPGTSGQYSLFAVTEHEIDEILGLASALPGGLIENDPLPEDLFRYGSAGARNYTTAGDNAYFSIDGSTLLARFNNVNNGGDYGDWHTGGTPQVQDAFATPNAHPTLGVEIRALDVIGYDLKSRGEPQVPEPGAMAMLAGVAVPGLLLLRKRRA